MRTYYPHRQDAAAAKRALELATIGAIRTTAEERDALHDVIYAVDAGLEVTQHTICRAHDVISRLPNRANIEE